MALSYCAYQITGRIGRKLLISRLNLFHQYPNTLILFYFIQFLFYHKNLSLFYSRHVALLQASVTFVHSCNCNMPSTYVHIYSVSQAQNHNDYIEHSYNIVLFCFWFLFLFFFLFAASLLQYDSQTSSLKSYATLARHLLLQNNCFIRNAVRKSVDRKNDDGDDDDNDYYEWAGG